MVAVVPVEVHYSLIGDAGIGYRGRLAGAFGWELDVGLWAGRRGAEIAESEVTTGVVRGRGHLGVAVAPGGLFSYGFGCELRNRRVPADIDLREGGTLRSGLRGRVEFPVSQTTGLALGMQYGLLDSESVDYLYDPRVQFSLGVVWRLRLRTGRRGGAGTSDSTS